MKLYNTLTRSIEEFKPQNKGKVAIYTCGPTVYDYQHIGNYTSVIRADTLARALRWNGIEPNWYINITDVGHLVSDADEGEDKLEKGARREGKTAWEVARFYTEDYLKGLDILNISVDRSHLVKATDHIDEQIDLIKTLEKKGFTYQIDDGVYFDSTKFPTYGQMAKLDLDGLQGGARVDMGQKKHPSDFALWKLTPKGQKRDMEWDSPWGKGFPGWHIECSAMAMKYLGQTLDIHTGGIDHIPVHHTNEIAQSEAATGQQFVRRWMHSNFLKVNGSKISKSLGNGYTLQDLSAMGYSGMDFRMFVLQSHYQTESNFTWEGLSGARTRLYDLQAAADLRFQPVDYEIDQTTVIENTQKAMNAALRDNLNTPLALTELSAFVTAITQAGLSKQSVEKFTQFLNFIDSTLGFNLLAFEDISHELKDKIKRREAAREQKDWVLSDKLRDELLHKKIGLNDTTHGAFWYRTSQE